MIMTLRSQNIFMETKKIYRQFHFLEQQNYFSISKLDYFNCYILLHKIKAEVKQLTILKFSQLLETITNCSS